MEALDTTVDSNIGGEVVGYGDFGSEELQTCERVSGGGLVMERQQSSNGMAVVISGHHASTILGLQSPSF